MLVLEIETYRRNHIVYYYYHNLPTPAVPVVSSVKEKTEAYKGMRKIASDQLDVGLRNHGTSPRSCLV